MVKHPLSLEQFKRAQKNIQPWIRPTILRLSRTISKVVSKVQKKSVSVYLKMENKQVTGSFKVRGALNKILNLPPLTKKKLFVSCSAGNHAQGVAYVARCLGGRAVIVVPVNTPLVKQKAIRAYGAEVLKHGQVYDESYVQAQALCEEKSGVFIPAYHDPFVIAGQGSIGLELLSELPDMDSVIVPIGGGGLIGGIAGVIKQRRPQCKVYGVVSSLAPVMEYRFHHRSYQPERHFKGPGLADGISVKQPDKKMFDTYLAPYIDDIVCVTENEIAQAMLFLLERGKTLVEGSGAVTIAALSKAQTNWKLGKKCVALLSGGNVDLNMLAQVIKKYFTEF